MDTDTNVYYGYLLTENKSLLLLTYISVDAVSMIMVRSV